jgi:NADH-quinone oxidoreductase subunit N
MLPSLHEFIRILPEGILLLTALGLILYAAFSKTDNKPWEQTTRAMFVAIGGLVAALMVTILTRGAPEVIMHAMLSADPFVTYAKGFILVASILAFLMILPHVDRFGIARVELPALLLFAILGMLVMVSCQDLMSLFLGLEMQSLAIYVVAAFARDDQRSNEAAMKYFVLGALSSAVLLYGISLVYGYAGTTNFDALYDTFREQMEGPVNLGLQFGVILMLCGMAFKVSAVPFHMWTPDVYDGLPTPTTAFFAAVPKLAAVLMVYRLIFGPLEPLASILVQPLTILALASAFFGGVAGVYQTYIKRLMAYSSISHVGFILLGLVAHNEMGVQGALFYLAAYFAMTAAFFVCILCLKRDGRNIEKIADLKGLNQEHPLLSAVISLLLFSMAGIPPLAGFFAKFYVILSLVESGHFVTACLAIGSSVVAAFFYIRIVKVIYFDKKAAIETDMTVFQHVRLSSGRLVLIVCLAALALMSVVPEKFLNKTYAPTAHILHT